MDDELSTLSDDYVRKHIFKKLSDTFEKYRNILPAIEGLEQAIFSEKQYDDSFQLAMILVEKLKSHGEKSEIIKEIFENVRRDFWHGILPEQVSPYEGKYYINSVAD